MARPPLRRGLAASVAAAFLVWLAVHLLLPGQLPRMVWLPSFAALCAFVALTVAMLARHYPHPAFGWCNAVTMLRGSLALTLLTPLLAGTAAGWTVAGIAGVALALDGVDGHLARRHERVSDFGARFDMEVDSVLALLLAVHAAVEGHGGPVVLFLGGARYAFVAASAVLPFLAAPLSPRAGRKTVCVLQLGTLIVLQLPLLGPGISLVLACAVSAALALSFALDIAWLARRRK